MLHTPIRLTATALACAAMLTLAACDNRNTDQTAGAGQPAGQAVDRPAEQTAGQRVDSAISTMEQKADAVGTEMKQGVEAAKDGAAAAIDTATQTARDAAITTQINADLARDPELSALKINVDTSNGKVVLKGTAPTATAKDRAAAKAMAVAGVIAVDNQLRVDS